MSTSDSKINSKTNVEEGEESNPMETGTPNRKTKGKKNHNLIEQKRRQKINEKIEELKGLVQPQYANQNKANVLEGTIESIRTLRILCSKLLAQHRVLQDEYNSLMAEHTRLQDDEEQPNPQPPFEPSSTLNTPNGSPPIREEEQQPQPPHRSLDVTGQRQLRMIPPATPLMLPLPQPQPQPVVQHPSGPIPSFPTDLASPNPLYPPSSQTPHHPSTWTSHHPPSLLNSNNESFLREHPFLQRLVPTGVIPFPLPALSPRAARKVNIPMSPRHGRVDGGTQLPDARVVSTPYPINPLPMHPNPTIQTNRSPSTSPAPLRVIPFKRPTPESS